LFPYQKHHKIYVDIIFFKHYYVYFDLILFIRQGLCFCYWVIYFSSFIK